MIKKNISTFTFFLIFLAAFTFETKAYFPCHHCDYNAQTISELKKHIKGMHNPEGPLKCGLCGFETNWEKTFKNHILQKHGGKGLFQCTHCKYKALSKKDLSKHALQQHTGKRPFPCQLCRYAAKKRTTLIKHILQIHRGEGLHPCKLCKFLALSEESLSEHILQQKCRRSKKTEPKLPPSREEPFSVQQEPLTAPRKQLTCIYCGYQTTDEKDRDSHLETPFCCFDET